MSPESARKLLTFPAVKIISAIKRHRPASITTLAQAVGRGADAVRADLRVLEQLGVVDLRDTGRKSGPIAPRLLYDEVQIRIRG